MGASGHLSMKRINLQPAKYNNNRHGCLTDRHCHLIDAIQTLQELIISDVGGQGSSGEPDIFYKTNLK